MAKTTYECVAGVESFSVTDADGKAVTVEAGKDYSTDDPALIRELDAAPHAVKRVKG